MRDAIDILIYNLTLRLQEVSDCMSLLEFGSEEECDKMDKVIAILERKIDELKKCKNKDEYKEIVKNKKLNEWVNNFEE